MSQDQKSVWTVIINILLALLTAIASAIGVASCADALANPVVQP